MFSKNMFVFVKGSRRLQNIDTKAGAFVSHPCNLSYTHPVRQITRTAHCYTWFR